MVPRMSSKKKTMVPRKGDALSRTQKAVPAADTDFGPDRDVRPINDRVAYHLTCPSCSRFPATRTTRNGI
jgi:hypothetical protein